ADESARCTMRDLAEGIGPLAAALRFEIGEPRLATLLLDRPPGAAPPVRATDLGRLVERLTAEFDHVVLEAPGLLAYHASELVAGESDGYVLVVRRGTSTEGQVAGTTALVAPSP